MRMTKTEKEQIQIANSIRGLNNDYFNKLGYEIIFDDSSILWGYKYTVWICEMEGSKKILNTYSFSKLEEANGFLWGMTATILFQKWTGVK